MPGLVPGIYVLAYGLLFQVYSWPIRVDGRVKPGHDSKKRRK
jgi:hypothetical protein